MQQAAVAAEKDELECWRRSLEWERSHAKPSRRPSKNSKNSLPKRRRSFKRSGARWNRHKPHSGPSERLWTKHGRPSNASGPNSIGSEPSSKAINRDWRLANGNSNPHKPQLRRSGNRLRRIVLALESERAAFDRDRHDLLLAQAVARDGLAKIERTRKEIAEAQSRFASDSASLGTQQASFQAAQGQLETEKAEFCRQQEVMEKGKMAWRFAAGAARYRRSRLAEKGQSIETELQSLAGLQAEIEGERAAVKQEGRENASQRARLEEMQASLHHDREEIERQGQSLETDRGRHERREAEMAEEIRQLADQQTSLAEEKQRVDETTSRNANERDLLDAERRQLEVERHKLATSRQELVEQQSALDSASVVFTGKRAALDDATAELERRREQLLSEQESLATERTALESARRAVANDLQRSRETDSLSKRGSKN